MQKLLSLLESHSLIFYFAACAFRVADDFEQYRCIKFIDSLPWFRRHLPDTKIKIVSVVIIFLYQKGALFQSFVSSEADFYCPENI